MHRPNISRILAGKEQVTLERAGRIAKALHLDLADLISTKAKILQEIS
jgi:plasmid maintenance system antidote protein VapI